MVMDFGHLKEMTRSVVRSLGLEHQNLNETLECKNPTAEFIALRIWDRFESSLKQDEDKDHPIWLTQVKVWETPNQAASINLIREQEDE